MLRETHIKVDLPATGPADPKPTMARRAGANIGATIAPTIALTMREVASV